MADHSEIGGDREFIPEEDWDLVPQSNENEEEQPDQEDQSS